METETTLIDKCYKNQIQWRFAFRNTSLDVALDIHIVPVHLFDPNPNHSICYCGIPMDLESHQVNVIPPYDDMNLCPKCLTFVPERLRKFLPLLSRDPVNFELARFSWSFPETTLCARFIPGYELLVKHRLRWWAANEF